MAWETVSNYYSGQGVVMIGPRDTAGTSAKPGGLLEVGNVSELKLSVNTSTVEHKETTTGARAIDLRLTTEIKANLMMTIENFSAKNLAQALRGKSAAVTTGTVTAEAVKAYPGFIMPLAHIKVSAVVIKTTGGSPVTLTVDDDYSVNLEAGSIKWLEGGANSLTAGQEVTVAYSYAAQNKVEALTEPMPTIWMRFEGLNTADTNKPVVIDVFKFSTDPLKELDLIGDKVNAFALEGTILADLSQPSGQSRYFATRLLA